MPEYKLSYFNIRGIAEPIRYILHYVGAPFEDYRIERSEWENHKANYPWGVLPKFEDNGMVISQSVAIGRYLARKHKLTGASEYEAAKCDEYGDAIKDFTNEIKPLFFEKDESKKEALRTKIIAEAVPKYIVKLEADLKANGGKFLVGKQYTWIDFWLAHYGGFIALLGKETVDRFPTIKGHMETIFNIPQIKDWIAKRPVTPM